jgi:hypothetical protein
MRSLADFCIQFETYTDLFSCRTSGVWFGKLLLEIDGAENAFDDAYEAATRSMESTMPFEDPTSTVVLKKETDGSDLEQDTPRLARFNRAYDRVPIHPCLGFYLGRMHDADHGYVVRSNFLLFRRFCSFTRFIR